LEELLCPGETSESEDRALTLLTRPLFTVDVAVEIAAILLLDEESSELVALVVR
jgi:hypothetical protein